MVNYATAKTSDTDKYAQYFRYMLQKNIHLAPAQFEAMFLSCAHTREELERVLETVKEFFQKI